MMDLLHLSDFQDVVADWADHNFGKVDEDERRNPVASTLGLCEEAGEVARAVLKQHQGIRGTWREWQTEAAKELGDVVIKCAEVAAVMGIDLEQAVRDRWEVVGARDLRADPQQHGIGDGA